MPKVSDELRQIAFLRRTKSTSNGKRIQWSDEHLDLIRKFIDAQPERVLTSAIAPPVFDPRKIEATKVKMQTDGIIKKDGSASASRRWVFRISDESVDLSGDSVSQLGWDFSGFRSNAPVLNSHNSDAPPVAVSSQPWLSGTASFAVAKFPPPETSPAADQVHGLVAAGVLKGASVGFKPIKFEFSKDPSRPMGVNFQQHRLLEWSICSIPCNPNCLAVGAAQDPKAPTDAPPMPKTRTERMSEVARIRREVGRL